MSLGRFRSRQSVIASKDLGTANDFSLSQWEVCSAVSTKSLKASSEYAMRWQVEFNGGLATVGFCAKIQ